MTRKFVSALAIAAMLGSTAAYAADTQTAGALMPGKAAGVQQAEILGVPTPVALLISAAIIAVIVVAVSNSGNNASKTTH
ncbi:MAG TPA: hypothetical protein VLV55_02945 [Rhizomicrobium sp.]|nr:hypothetical protein [Rhizomicrobium sp.]